VDRVLAKALRRAAALRPLRRRSVAILFEREGALGVSTSDDPAEVEVAEGAARAVARARAAGVAVGVVSSAGGEGSITSDAAERVNARVDELVGPIDVWLECTHDQSEDCPCRKPAPGLIYLAAAALGTRPERCVVVGDREADLAAAEAAGARAVLVPSARTTAAEIDAAPAVASSLDEAVAIVLGEAA
jgi:D-glycero-D-manno-heptose 1,7-bisphosphate phosphatase